jgi:hypothetical protein
VTVYNHMDVQPAQEPEWKQAPFAFQNESGIYRGRGATDDKGPALAALFGARYAIEQGVPINVRFSVGTGRGKRQSKFRGGDQESCGDPTSGLGGDFGYDLAVEESACDALWTAGSCSARASSCVPAPRTPIRA